MENPVLFKIKNKYSKLSKSEKIAADYILNYKKNYENLSISKISEKANISQPTIIRFARALGYKGFKELKYALIQNQPTSNKKQLIPMGGLQLTGDEKIEDIPAKVTLTITSLLENALKSISITDYIKLINVLKNSKNITIFAIENSAATAIDLNVKLSYLGLNCTYNTDPYLQKVNAANLKKGDVAIGISYSGCSAITVENLKTAKKSGATTVALTNFNKSHISKYADITIYSSSAQYFYGNTIFSRTTQLAIIDMTYIGLLISDYSKYTKKLDKNKELIISLDNNLNQQSEKM
ncbi:MAG: MurR/RpiR family transcriptional regulator [Lachnospirales bacterium]